MSGICRLSPRHQGINVDNTGINEKERNICRVSIPPHTMDSKSLAGAVGHLTEVHHKNFGTTLNFCTTSVVQNLFFENIIHGQAQSKSEMRGTVLVFLFRYTDGRALSLPLSLPSFPSISLPLSLSSSLSDVLCLLPSPGMIVSACVYVRLSLSLP
jgi:hypothetical protein